LKKSSIASIKQGGETQENKGKYVQMLRIYKNKKSHERWM